MKHLLAEAISELPEKEQRVLALYYYEELTMKEVGAALGIGESRVSQIHSLAMVRLRARLNFLTSALPPSRVPKRREPPETIRRSQQFSQVETCHQTECLMEKVLNQQEIDDMVRKARTGNAAAGATGPVVQPWDIRQAGQIGSEQLRAINQLHEIFARNLTTAVGGTLRIVFRLQPGFRRASHLPRVPAARPGKNLSRVLRSRAGRRPGACFSSISPSPSPSSTSCSEAKARAAKLPATSPRSKNRFSKASFASCAANCKPAGRRFRSNSISSQRQHILQTQRLMPPGRKKSLPQLRNQNVGNPRHPQPRRPRRGFQRLAQKNFRRLQLPAPPQSHRGPPQIQKRLLNCSFPVELSMPGLQVLCRPQRTRSRRPASLFQERRYRRRDAG